MTNDDTPAQVRLTDVLGHSRERVSLLGAQRYIDAVNAALDAFQEAVTLLRECERTLEMWEDVAPAVSLRADIRKLIARVA